MIQRAQCKRVRELVRSSGVRIVHQVTPVRPRHPAFFRELGVPIVMGPLSESADAPPGFCEQASSPQRALDLLAHLATALLHRVFPGRLRAEALLVADAKSSRAVPGRASGRKFRLAADGVDLTKWKGRDAPPARDVPKFLFVGRLSAGCGADHLLDAFRLTLDAGPARLEIAAEGPMRGALERRAEALDLSRDVEFSGWLGGDARRHAIEQADALVYPGLRGAGTDVVMHAMASGLPVVATSWGAAAEIASDGAGLLVGPRTKRQFTNELANVMHRLAASPSLRRELGERAQVHARNEFDWNHRLDRLSDVYRQLVNDAGGQRQPDKSPRGDEASR